MVFSAKVKQRLPFAHHHVFNLSDKYGVISCILCGIQAALEIGQRAMQHRSSVRRTIKPRPGFFLRVLVDTADARIVLRNCALIFRQNIYSEPFLGVQMRMRPRPLIDTHQHQWGPKKPK